jgi:hypothetical protein
LQAQLRAFVSASLLFCALAVSLQAHEQQQQLVCGHRLLENTAKQLKTCKKIMSIY